MTMLPVNDVPVTADIGAGIDVDRPALSFPVHVTVFPTNELVRDVQMCLSGTGRSWCV